MQKIVFISLSRRKWQGVGIKDVRCAGFPGRGLCWGTKEARCNGPGIVAWVSSGGWWQREVQCFPEGDRNKSSRCGTGGDRCCSQESARLGRQKLLISLWP